MARYRYEGVVGHVTISGRKGFRQASDSMKAHRRAWPKDPTEVQRVERVDGKKTRYWRWRDGKWEIVGWWNIGLPTDEDMLRWGTLER